MAVKAVLSCHKIRFSFQKRLLVIADYIEEGTFESTCLRGQLTISEQRAWVPSELQRGSSPSLLITMFKAQALLRRIRDCGVPHEHVILASLNTVTLKIWLA